MQDERAIQVKTYYQVAKAIKAKTYYEIVKAIIFGIIITAMLFAGVKTWSWINARFDRQEEQLQIELEDARQSKYYADNFIRAHTDIVSSLKAEIERLKDRKSDATDAMLSDINKKNEIITNMGETIAELNENIRKLRTSSDHTYKAGTGDPNEQYFIDIMYPIKNENGKIEREVPYAWAIFYPNKPEDKKWKYGIYKLDYHIRTVQAEQEDGQLNTYNEVWFESNDRKASKGVEVPVKIASSEFKQSYKKEKEFYLWAPHASINVDFGIGNFDVDDTIVPGISVSMSGYGRTKNDLDWKFVELGLNSTGDYTYLKFSPFSYNVGKFLPLISNTFVGPFVGYSNKGETSFGVGISIPF